MTDFRLIADYFYNILISNFADLKDVINRSDIYTVPDAAGKKNICVQTNWVPLGDISDDLYPFEDGELLPTALGFITSYTIQSGLNGTGQGAINTNVAILQKLIPVLNSSIKNRTITLENDITINIIKTDLVSDYNIVSDQLEAVVNIYGV